MENKILVETSARHVHLTQEAVEILFGAGHTLTNKKDLSQPGHFACEEKVTVVGPKGSIKASVLGPTRSANQVELSLTDARTVGLVAPIRESGDVAGTPGCRLEGPCGAIDIAEGVIAAKRHIHFNVEQAAAQGVVDKQVVSVRVQTEQRSLIFGDVVCRVNPNFEQAMHIDTDESNAACASGVVYGEIVR